ncbi:MAG: hypothetical protein ABSC60_05165 [Acidobacteriota bacterium]|jgi:hypothetical protein
MSGRNGDKARYDRERKKKILRQKHTRELRRRLSLENKGAQATSTESK